MLLQALAPSKLAWHHSFNMQSRFSPSSVHSTLPGYHQKFQTFTVHHYAAASANTVDAVHVEFGKAGLSVEATSKVLKQYKPYINWDVESRLRPMIQLWLQELGSEQLPVCLQQQPRLLLHKPSEYDEVYQWLSSLGLDADRIKSRSPRVMVRELEAVQATVKAFQHALQLTDADLPAVLYKHYTVLKCSPESVLPIVHAAATVLGHSPGSAEFRELFLALNARLFDHKPSNILSRVTYFCKQYGMGGNTAQIALKQNVCSVPEATMQLRAAGLQVMLGWDDLQLKRKLSSAPSLLTRQPSAIAVTMKNLQGLGFSVAQALDMCTSNPVLMMQNWTSALGNEKIKFLTLLLGLAIDNVAARSRLLMYSVPYRLGPRVCFIFQCGVLDTPKTVLLSGHLSNICGFSNAEFSKKYNRPMSSPPMLYDTAYIRHWQERWQFLTHNMKLFVEDIAAHQALLLASLHDTLAPRWHFFTLLAAHQPGFKAEDHLTAMATLSDQEFAEVYNIDSLNIAYDKSFRQQGHDD